MDLDAHMRSQTIEQLKLFEISVNFQAIFQAMLFTKFEVFWIYLHINGITGLSAIAIALAYLFICFEKDTMEIFKEKSHNSKTCSQCTDQHSTVRIKMTRYDGWKTESHKFNQKCSGEYHMSQKENKRWLIPLSPPEKKLAFLLVCWHFHTKICPQR